MKAIKNSLLKLLCATNLISCRKDVKTANTDFPVQRFERKITFKVIGEYSGTLHVSYVNPTNEYGVAQGEVLTTIPWQKDFDYNRQVKLTVLKLSGQNGQPKETVQIQVYSDGELIETELGITDEQGKLNSETSIIFFK